MTRTLFGFATLRSTAAVSLAVVLFLGAIQVSSQPALAKPPLTFASALSSATSTKVSKAITFAPGSTKLSSQAKANLVAMVEPMRLTQKIQIVGFASVKTAKNKVRHDALARAASIKSFLKGMGISPAVSVKNGGFSSRTLKASVADRAVISFAQTPGLLWAQDFNDPKGIAPSAYDFSSLTGDGCEQLGLCTYGTGEKEINDKAAAATDGKGNLVIHTSYSGGTWKSARIWTAQKVAFEFGQLEIRAQFPTGDFNWPAIWMLGDNYAPPNHIFGAIEWPASGELDIAEGLQGNSAVQGTLHGLNTDSGGDWNGGAGVTGIAPLNDVSGAFHIWGIRWLPNLVIFTMDGQEYCRDAFDGNSISQQMGNGFTSNFDSKSNWPFNQPFFLILNNAIPGGVSAPDGTTSDFKIDWIHYSSFNGYGRVIR